MITGFGNNTVSALASDITATQTTFSVLPGAGAKFANLLTTDFLNAGSPHGVYAKLTITDSQGTVFEICHLTAVSADTLTVIRGQEGTAAKGWSLNDVIANFATRGSEQSFVQIEQLQGGDFTSATACGTPNALAISLPSTFFNNVSSDWLLKTPLIITPIATNSAPATLQITLGGKVIGTFPLYKGNKNELDASDIVSGIPFCCILDQTKTFLNVINPTAAYFGKVRSVNSKSPDINGNVQITASDVGALTQVQGDARYVNLAGDTMTGNLIAPYVTTAGITSTNGYVTINAVYYNNNQYARFLAYASDGTTQLGYMEFDYNKNCSFAVNGRAFSMDNQGAFHSPGPIYESTSVRVYSPNNPQPIPKNTASLGSNGWWRDADTGMIKQWINNINIPVGATAGATVNFPITFPNRCLSVVVAVGGTAGTDMIGWTNATSTNVYVVKSGQDTVARTVNIEVIGY